MCYNAIIDVYTKEVDVMEKIKVLLKNDTILYRMIAVFSMVSMVVILLLTTVIFSLFSTTLKDEIYCAQVQNLKQISNTVIFRAEYVNSLMLQAKEDELISKLFYSDDDSQASSIKKRLDDIRGPVKQLNSIYVYNEYSDRIYYSGENMLPFINSTMSFDDQGFVDILKNIDQYPKYTPILRKMSVEWPVGRVYERYVFTYLIYDSYTSGARNIMAFNFHLSWMEDALDFITTGQATTEDIWIIDSERQIVYTNTGELIGVTSERVELSDEVFLNESGYIITGTGDDRQMIVYATSSRYGYDEWTFVSWNDYATLMKPLEQVKRTIYICCGIVFLISLFVVFRASYVLYKPVRSTMDRVEVLEKENDKKRKIERMLFLRRFFQGDIIDDNDLRKILFARHQIEDNWDEDIQIVLISIDNMNEFIKSFGRRVDEASEIIERIISACFQKWYGKTLCVRMHDGLWAVCIPTQEDRLSKTTLFDELSQSVNDRFNISISMASSQIGHFARDIPYLYSDAVNVHSYRFLLGQNRLITYEDIQKQGQGKFDYPYEIEKKLLSHLLNGKYTEAIEDYEEFIAEIRWFRVDEIRLSCMLLAYAVKSSCQKSMAEPSGLLVEFDEFYKKLQTVETINEVHEMYYRLIKEITNKLKRDSKERHESMIARIEAYVEKNYGNINLSMNEISDHVNMSSAYLGRLFKQVTGNAFSEYLTKFRLNKACALLRNTDLTVNEISDQVGFTNSSYFYIIFKKNLECTPNQYRKQFRNDADE